MFKNFKLVYHLTQYVTNETNLPISRRIKRFFWVYLNAAMLYPLFHNIAVHQQECLKKLKKNNVGVLFLSNHSSNMDGNLIYAGFAYLGWFLNIWAHDFVYKLPFIGTGISSIGNVKIPYLANSRQKKDEKIVHKAITRTVDGLKKGKHYMFFPSGHSKRTVREEIRGTSGLHQILKLYPDVPIVLIRHTGMWGTRFSWAYERPSYCKSESHKWRIIFSDYLKMLVGNLLFFIPKINFDIRLEVAQDNFPRHGSRKELNCWLERYFNQDYPEPLTVVSDYFWINKCIKQSCSCKKAHFDLGAISEDIRTKVMEVISKKAQIPCESIHENQIFDKDLNLDSLELISILCELEKEFNHKPIKLGQVLTVGHLMAILAEAPVEIIHEKVSFEQEILTH